MDTIWTGNFWKNASRPKKKKKKKPCINYLLSSNKLSPNFSFLKQEVLIQLLLVQESGSSLRCRQDKTYTQATVILRIYRAAGAIDKVVDSHALKVNVDYWQQTSAPGYSDLSLETEASSKAKNLKELRVKTTSTLRIYTPSFLQYPASYKG